jgi:hypothetical protein
MEIRALLASTGVRGMSPSSRLRRNLKGDSGADPCGAMEAVSSLWDWVAGDEKRTGVGLGDQIAFSRFGKGLIVKR